jgi:hypothetical protein
MNDLVLAVSRAVDAVRSDIPDKAVWVPLEAVLPLDECAGFMFMGAKVGAIMPKPLALLRDKIAADPPTEWDRRMIFSYKHGITRKYLHIGGDLMPYTYRGSNTDFSLSTYSHVHQGMDYAITCAFSGLEKLGASRTTAYSDAYIAARNARLVAAGYTVVG